MPQVSDIDQIHMRTWIPVHQYLLHYHKHTVNSNENLADIFRKNEPGEPNVLQLSIEMQFIRLRQNILKLATGMIGRRHTLARLRPD